MAIPIPGSGEHIPVEHAETIENVIILIDVPQQTPPMQSLELAQEAEASGAALPSSPGTPLSVDSLPLLAPVPLLLPLLAFVLPPLLDPQATAVAMAHDAASKMMEFFM